MRTARTASEREFSRISAKISIESKVVDIKFCAVVDGMAHILILSLPASTWACTIVLVLLVSSYYIHYPYIIYVYILHTLSLYLYIYIYNNVSFLPLFLSRCFKLQAPSSKVPSSKLEAFKDRGKPDFRSLLHTPYSIQMP